jgi:protein disulfide-isomerase A5
MLWILVDAKDKEGGNVELEHVTAKTFSTVISGDSYTLVFFYAPWCSACTEAKPEFKAAADKIKSEMTDRLFVAVNCDDDQNTGLCSTHNIQGYPTIKLFQKGKFIGDFPDSFTQAQFYAYMKNPPHIGEFRKPSGGEDKEESLNDPQMKGVKYLEGSTALKELQEVTHAMVFFYAPWCPHCADAKPKYETAALALKEKKEAGEDAILMAMNCDDAKNQDFCAEQNVEGYPTVRYYQRGELFAEYEQDIEANKLIEYMKNPPKEKVPPTQIEDTEVDNEFQAVTHLNEGNFTEVTEKTQHCVVMFYTNGCKGCHDGKIMYQEAAEILSYSPMENKVVAAVDCEDEKSKKVCEEQKIQKLPLIKYYSKGKLVEDFPRQVTINDIMEYIRDLGKEKTTKKDEL